MLGVKRRVTASMMILRLKNHHAVTFFSFPSALYLMPYSKDILDSSFHSNFEIRMKNPESIVLGV